MWPTGMKDLGVAVSGKIGPALAAEPGRALGRLTDVGWGTRLRTLLADDAPDEPAGTDLIGALIKVLAAWDWADRPVAMMASGRAAGTWWSPSIRGQPPC